jgi:hypothetical protein
MTDEEKIAGAAEIIRDRLGRQGTYVSIDQAAHLAKQLYGFWSERIQIHDLPAGEVAQRMWERYEQPQVHYPNGAPMFAPDGMMLDEQGNRSIFDDVDE